MAMQPLTSPSAAAGAERSCTLLVSYDLGSSSGQSTVSKESEFQKLLESKDEDDKIHGLKCIIQAISLGEQFPRLLMSVIKYCLHTENHIVKKLLLLYWEVVDKKSPDGTLLHEMILVCNAMKNNLTHPNEYIRGSTLRFLTHISEEQILESLIPSVTANLEHRHSYVRKNAVLTVYTIYSQHPDLIPDTPELIDTFLYAETNPSAKRNAFLMLYYCDVDRALTYLNSILPTLNTMSESFQLVVLELIRKTVRTNPLLKGQYLKPIYNIIQNNSAPAVQFEGSNTLVALSSAPTAIRTAVQSYCKLLHAESDTNIKLIILQRLTNLRKRNEKILQDMIMDILATLSAPNLEIRKHVLELVQHLLSTRNVSDVVTLLRKELLKTELQDFETIAGIKSESYKKLVIENLHVICQKFPSQIPSVITLLLQFLTDDNIQSSLDVIFFIRETVATNTALRNEILSRLSEQFNDIKASDVYRVALWILSEYSIEPAILDLALSTVRSSIGPLPLLTSTTAATTTSADKVEEEQKQNEETKIDPSELAPKSTKSAKNPLIMADGTYASQSAVISGLPTNGLDSTKNSSLLASTGQHSNLRALLISGDWYLASALVNSITKLVIRFGMLNGSYTSTATSNEITQTLLLCVSLLRLGSHKSAAKPIDTDCYQRIVNCIEILLHPSEYSHIATTDNEKIFLHLLDVQHSIQEKSVDKKTDSAAAQIKRQTGLNVNSALDIDLSQPDDLILIRQLKTATGDDDLTLNEEGDDAQMTAATLNKSVATTDISTQLSRIYALTGFNDPIYAETQLIVHDYDILLNITIINQTDSLLANLNLELHTSGDLKIVDRPATHNLRARGELKLSVTIKMSTTEAGLIFGNLTYDTSKGEKQIIVLNNIHMDVMDYIIPGTVSDVAFRSMWAEFEWENKVAVNTEIADLTTYLQHIIKITNMNNLTPGQTLDGGESAFLAANLYARSMFGEDALLNLSVEKQAKTGKITGYIRIRSKTQGIALSLGDKVTAKQRQVNL